MKKHILSKSTFIRGLQCHKSLYLYKKRYYLRDRLSTEQQARFKRGTEVGVYARQLFSGGIDLSPPTPFQYAAAVEKTREMTAIKTPVIYEASFRHNGVLVVLDILEYREGKWFGYEVKSSIKVSETYMMDAALQYYVISGSGIELSDLFIIYMNMDYVLEGDLVPEALFTRISVLEESMKRKDLIEQEIIKLIAVTKLTKSPAIEIGRHCNYPYPCDFIGHCWKHIPENSIFDLCWLSDEQKFKLYEKGILYPKDIPAGFLSDPSQNDKLQAHLKGNIIADNPFINDFINEIQHSPVFLITWYHAPAIPVFEHTRPYEKLPFYMAAGIITEPVSGISIKTRYFDPNAHPAEVYHELIAELLRYTENFIVYNDESLVGIMNNFISSRKPENKPKIYDLSEIANKNHFYHPTTMGCDELKTLGTSILNLQPPLKGFFAGEAEAIIAYRNIQESAEKHAIFIKTMETTASYYLKCLAGYYNYLKKLMG